jgi:beta-glucosidase
MHQIPLAIASAFFLSLVSSAFAQTPPAPTEPDAVGDASTSTTTPSGTHYLQKPMRLEAIKKRVAEFKGKPVDLIFIGDSITARWLRPEEKPLWDKYYAPLHALDFGVPGDKTQEVLWRLDNMDLKEFHPRVAVIMIGTNNGHNTAQEIADGVRAVVATTKRVFPGVKIILVSITPSKYSNETKMAADAILRTYADNSTVYYLDLVPLMPPVGDNWKGISPDHLHPDVTGFQIWHDAMAPLLTKLLAGSK